MMTRLFLPLLLAMVGAVTAVAQDIQGIVPAGPRSSSPTEVEEPLPQPPPPPVPDEIVTIIPPTEMMTTNIAFIVDTSGSMNSDGRVGMAITFANSIIGREGDQLMISLFSFKSIHTRWPGMTANEIISAKLLGTWDKIDGPPPPKGWTYFPGVPQLASAQNWLSARGANGGTNPASALNESLAEDIKHLTIVLISDGEDFDVPEFIKAIIDGQKVRVDKGLGKAVIFIIGIGPKAHTMDHLRVVGETEGGGLFVVRRPQPPVALPVLLPDPLLDLNGLDDWDD